MRAWGLLIFFAASCASTPDPCAAFSGQACVDVEVRGLSGIKLDQLHVQSTALGIDVFDPDQPRMPAVPTPIVFAFLTGVSATPFDIVVNGLTQGVVRGRGTVTLPPIVSEHENVVIELKPLAADLAGLDLLSTNLGDLARLAPPDLSSRDLASHPASDLACGTTPDEDGDGLADACDPCPVDPSPLDTDSDGVADDCDPDPQKPGNKILMFDGFDFDDTTRWSGSSTVSGGIRSSPSLGRTLTTDTEDQLTDFRAELRFALVGTVEPEADGGLFVSDTAGSTAQGVKCMMRHSMSTGLDTLDADVFLNGASIDTGQQICRFSTTDKTLLRLTRRGSSWLCEATVGTDTTTCALTTTLAVATPVLQLESAGVRVDFDYAILESIAP